MTAKKIPEDIEIRIRKHYQDNDSGDWLVEKGKVAEAKMLKDAVSRIDFLLKRVDELSEDYSDKDNYHYEMWAAEQEKRQKIEKLLEEIQAGFNSHIWATEHVLKDTTEVKKYLKKIDKLIGE